MVRRRRRAGRRRAVLDARDVRQREEARELALVAEARAHERARVARAQPRRAAAKARDVGRVRERLRGRGGERGERGTRARRRRADGGRCAARLRRERGLEARVEVTCWGSRGAATPTRRRGGSRRRRHRARAAPPRRRGAADASAAPASSFGAPPPGSSAQTTAAPRNLGARSVGWCRLREFQAGGFKGSRYNSWNRDRRRIVNFTSLRHSPAADDNRNV